MTAVYDENSKRFYCFVALVAIIMSSSIHADFRPSPFQGIGFEGRSMAAGGVSRRISSSELLAALLNRLLLETIKGRVG